MKCEHAPRILLTGAAGFIGRQLVPHLQDAAELHGVSREPRRSSHGISWHAADLRDPVACAQLIAKIKPSHLAHLAWNTTHGKFWSAPDNSRWRDASTALVSAFATSGGARLVICGTGAEYAADAASPLGELTSSLNAATPYGQAKHALRMAAEPIAAEYGLSFAWARIFNVYGPYENPQRLVPSVIGALLHGERAKCTRGLQKRDFMHVGDVGRALADLLLAKVEGAINIGSSHVATIADVAGEIGRLMGRPELIELGALPDRAGEPPVQVPDVTRLRDELGFMPHFNLEQGLRHTISWWQERAGTFGGAEAKSVGIYE